MCVCESLPGMYTCEIMSLDGPLRCGIVTMVRKPPASSRQETGPPRRQTDPQAKEPKAECPQWVHLTTYRRPADQARTEPKPLLSLS